MKLAAAHLDAGATLAPPGVPDDPFDRRLLENVHPPGWTNPRPGDRYDLVVLGAGTAGLVSAVGAAGLGARVAIVERHLMGGDCLNVGCVPSKSIIRSARAMAAVRDAARFGIRGADGAAHEVWIGGARLVTEDELRREMAARYGGGTGSI